MLERELGEGSTGQHWQDGLSMLAEIHDWFTEGFDTKDLQEAKALLEELAEHSV